MMQKFIGFAAALGLSAGVPQAAHAQFQTGNQIYRDCLVDRTDDAYYQKSSFCMAYVSGAFDAILLARQVNGKPDCTPDGLTVGQMRDVALKYMRDHPENRNLSAAGIVLLSIMDAWPCPNN
ncbi:Rap1a/Tai family immunity protein [Sphingobium sp. ZW T5_29]|uniref:Rap1a/Tai family immunity protein n=1 Tax=Sphingobium sp. ZW T5_29 TaxID=3378077 RepID=UPI0038524DF7